MILTNTHQIHLVSSYHTALFPDHTTLAKEKFDFYSCFMRTTDIINYHVGILQYHTQRNVIDVAPVDNAIAVAAA